MSVEKLGINYFQIEIACFSSFFHGRLNLNVGFEADSVVLFFRNSCVIRNRDQLPDFFRRIVTLYFNAAVIKVV